jgi:HlyD family secretion protein
MKYLPVGNRTLAMLAVILPLLALLIYVALRSGPLAPVPVRLATVETRSIAPGVYGIGTVGALCLQDRPDDGRAGADAGCACG